MDSCQLHQLHPGLPLEAGAPVIPIEIQKLKGTIFLGLKEVNSKDGDAAADTFNDCSSKSILSMFPTNFVRLNNILL